MLSFIHLAAFDRHSASLLNLAKATGSWIFKMLRFVAVSGHHIAHVTAPIFVHIVDLQAWDGGNIYATTPAATTSAATIDGK